jgi:para-nitrobenzyl esterase
MACAGYDLFGLKLAKQRVLPELGGGDPVSSLKIVSILTSGLPQSAGPLPVMVWLHGGGFTIGAGGLPPYNGKALAARRGCGHDQLPSRSSRFRPSRAGREEDRVVHFALLDQIAALGLGQHCRLWRRSAT